MLDVTEFGADPAPESGDDAAAIRDAIAAADSGDEVVLPPGTYDLKSTHPNDDSANLLLRSGVHLRGAGASKTVLVTSFDGDDDSRVIRGAGVTDVIVADLTITSRHDGPLADDPNDADAGGGPMYGIHLGPRDGRPSSHMLVEHVRVERFERHGISAKATREVTLADNHLADATGVGPGGRGYGIAIEGTADQRDPRAEDDSRHNFVVGNRAGNALGNSGGKKHKHDASGEHNWVHGNTLKNNERGILVILGTPDTVVEDNDITAGDESMVGIEVRNGPGTIIRNNRISGGEGDFWAIRLREDDGADGRGRGVPRAVAVTDNRIQRSPNGIRIDAGDDIELADNRLSDIGDTKVRGSDSVD
ncbi:right-handed parallel beta-helix repeat-containing protein [Salinibacterium sp. GXW1014]|uniref:right-handed parallel beta-helix repeat-containing protein n=1 Tax=Salinibacterium sp. GXW1014 TaxID=3377838 RepID=UPI00383B42F4